MYYISDDALENCERWKYSFGHFGLSLSYNDSNIYIHLPFIEDEAIPEYVRPLMRRVVAACSHLGKDQEEKVKEISAILGGIYGEMYGKEDISNTGIVFERKKAILLGNGIAKPKRFRNNLHIGTDIAYRLDTQRNK